jgi:GT2 family glycosyltransferase
VTFAFIILHFKNSAITGRCIDSVRKACRETDKILVVDASHDLQLSNKERIHIVKPKDFNPGYARGMNIGAIEAKKYGCSIFAFINNDAVLPSDFCEQIKQVFADGHARVAAVGPKIVYFTHPDIVWSAGGRISKLRMRSVQINQFRNAHDVKGCFEAEFLSGCVFCIRSDVFFNVGGWPEAYFFGGEEWEISRRLRSEGFALKVAADIAVRHEADFVGGQGNSHSFSDLRFVVNSYLNRIVFAHRNYSLARAILFRAFLAAYVGLVMPFRWKVIGPCEHLFDKWRLSLRLLPTIVFRDGHRPITFHELAIIAKKLK